jgi:hypothetical protein
VLFKRIQTYQTVALGDCAGGAGPSCDTIAPTNNSIQLPLVVLFQTPAGTNYGGEVLWHSDSLMISF